MIEFRVSSFCSFGNCVEVGRTSDGAVVVRDTKDRAQQALTFTDEEWVGVRRRRQGRGVRLRLISRGVRAVATRDSSAPMASGDRQREQRARRAGCG